MVETRGNERERTKEARWMGCEELSGASPKQGQQSITPFSFDIIAGLH
jgi:hypothetical protein